MFSPSADESVRSDHWADTFIKYNSPATGFRRPKKNLPKKRKKKKEKRNFWDIRSRPDKGKVIWIRHRDQVSCSFCLLFSFCRRPVINSFENLGFHCWLGRPVGFLSFSMEREFRLSVDGNQLIVLGPEPFVRSFCFYTRHVIFYVNPVRSGNRSSCCGGIHSFLFSFFSLFIIVYCIPTDILTVFFFFFSCVCSRRAQNGGDLNSTTGTTNHLSKYWTLTKTIRWSIRTLDDVIRHLIGFFFVFSLSIFWI